jgi:hypothetical protein
MKAVKVPVQICGLISIVSEVEKHVPEPYALRNDQRQGPRITRFTQMLRELQYPFTADLDQDQVTLLILSAEREIAAYRRAVLDLYGPKPRIGLLMTGSVHWRLRTGRHVAPV